MSSGHKIRVGKTIKIKNGKIVRIAHYRDASHAIAAKKSKRQRPIRRVV